MPSTPTGLTGCSKCSKASEVSHMTITLQTIAKMIDHSLLHPTMTDTELVAGCRLAVRHHVASVCIKPYAVPMAKELLAGSDVLVGTVIGFPHGNSRVDVKLLEAERALTDGAVELDMVVNIGKVLSRAWAYVSDEIRALNELTVSRGALLKVIFENDYLADDALKVRLCQMCSEHAVAFVKTSTGYGFVKRENGMYSYAGATDHDLALMRAHSLPSVQVKAAGGVRTLDDVLRVRALGVTRVGATATEAILAEAQKREMQ
jgi:deoxyribose-phosphate aldolase